MREAATAIGRLLIGKEESSAIRHRILSAVRGLIGLRIAFSGLSFLVTLLLARLLQPAGFGSYSYALAWIVVLSIPALLGMDQFLVRTAAVFQANGQWGMLRGLLRKANWAVSSASAALVLLALGAVWLGRDRWPAESLKTFGVALPLLALIPLTRVRQGAMQGLHRVALGALPEQLIQPALLLALLGLAYLFRRNVLAAPVAMGLNVAATAVAFAVGAALLRRTIPAGAKHAAPVHRDLEWRRSVLPLMFLASAGVLFAQADTLILGALKGPAAVGPYSVAHKGADLISYFLTIQNAAFASTIASLYASGDMKTLQRLVTRLARFTFLATVPVAAGLIIFSGAFLSLYGVQFTSARLALMILSFGQLINVGFGSVGILLTMTGHERNAAAAIGGAAIMNIALNFALIPRWGVEGAAFAYACSMILWNVWMAISLRQKAGLNSTALGRRW
ncbi:MAG TPA: oligosaccharide flippase family protein [Bryobacteraceae bacterium]|jgi:O-antigen/teichoic acid export membrane protein